MVLVSGNQDPIVNLVAEGQVALNQKEWQVAEIALEGLTDPITEIAFFGNLSGTFFLDDIRLVSASPGTVVQEAHTDGEPQEFALDANYPNPFNSGTVIGFALPRSEEIELATYNLTGQKVATLVAGRRQAGTYTVRWDGRDDQGRELASGLYLYRLQAGIQVETRKLVLVR